MTAYPTTGREQLSRWYWPLFIGGFLWSLLMAWRSQIGGDQGIMISLGWPLVDHGEWLQYGMPTSAGGRSPGGFMSLLMALPLWIWPDYRSPAFMLALVHAGTFLLLRRLLRPALTPQGEWLLLILVWFNPWRMYFSAHIWNSNYMFVAAVLHIGLAQVMREKHFVATASMCVLIALAMQLHTSAMLLAIATLLMYWKKLIKVHWGGFVLGTVLSVACYVPWLIEIAQHPELKPGNKGFFLRGLVYVFPLVRGILYWFKMSSLSFASRMVNVDFVDLPTMWNQLLKPMAIALGTVAHLTLLPVLLSQWRFFKRQYQWLQTRWRAPMQGNTPRAWLRRYIVLTAIAALISYAISPTTVMFWQAFIVLPASVLILIFWAEAALRTRLTARITHGTRIWLALSIALTVIQTFGTPQYRCSSPVPNEDRRLTAFHVVQQCHASE